MADLSVPPPLPSPRGELSSWLCDHLTRPPHPLEHAPPAADDPVTGEDAPLALYTIYELAYRGFQGVADDWELDLGLLRIRQQLEQELLARMRDELGRVEVPDDLKGWFQETLAPAEEEPSISSWCLDHGGLRHLREQAVLRSPWQLKENDPYSWAIPRLAGRPKAAIVEIQADEYGEGVQADIHAELFALHMERIGLDPAYGAYRDHVPGTSLATVNLVSLFGLHRRWRGALVGHLAGFEMASVPVMSRFAEALRRLGFDEWTCLFYDVHVVADAAHQRIAIDELVAGLLEQEPDLAADVMFGLRSLVGIEAVITERTLAVWDDGRSALRRPLSDDLPAPGREASYVPADDPRLAAAE